MQSKLAQAVRKSFAARLRQELPQFAEIKTREIPAGSRLYGWTVAPDLTCYLLLLLAPGDDRFTVELAWSRHGQFPAFLVMRLPTDAPVDGAHRFRLPLLWTDPRQDFWWQIGPSPDPARQFAGSPSASQAAMADLTQQAVTQVEDAVGHIVRDALPYFRQIAGAYGHEAAVG